MTTSTSVRTQLNALASALRHFHSALLDVAKSEYEFREGRIEGPFALYSLVMNHESFQWLRPLSGLMATLDEVTDSKTELTARNVQDVEHALDLLMGSVGTEFADFRAGYARASADPKVKETEARWRELLAQAVAAAATESTPGSLEA
ncbi:hypothetical protein Q0M94_01445 [Deinococcus radiomollis]|uniref:hypothetical protein n=1 Tax=Deinococcus radiomollis TaxID=468916 RepID=UPI0038925C8B